MFRLSGNLDNFKVSRSRFFRKTVRFLVIFSLTPHTTDEQAAPLH